MIPGNAVFFNQCESDVAGLAVANDSLSKLEYLGRDIKNISFEKFLQLVRGDNLAVSGYRRDDKWILTLGANYERSSPLALVTSILLSTAYLAVDPVSFGLFYFEKSGGENNVAFSMTLNGKLEAVNEPGEQAVYTKISAFVNKNSIRKQDPQVFYSRQPLLFGDI